MAACWGHGIVMGGGLGVMAGCSHRVVTEKTRIAMPEVTIALANTGALQIELIAQHNDAPSMYLDFLQAGNEGLHHLGYACEDYERDVAAYVARGYRIGHAGVVCGRGGFTYLDTETHPGTVVELFDMAHGRTEIYAAIEAAARDWDGSEPVRTRSPLA